jgi:hypothetical protein
VYRILVSREQGASGGGLLDWLDMATTLAEADASTGWTSGHGAVCSALVANIAEPPFVETVFADPTSLGLGHRRLRVLSAYEVSMVRFFLCVW